MTKFKILYLFIGLNLSDGHDNVEVCNIALWLQEVLTLKFWLQSWCLTV